MLLLVDVCSFTIYESIRFGSELPWRYLLYIKESLVIAERSRSHQEQSTMALQLLVSQLSPTECQRWLDMDRHKSIDLCSSLLLQCFLPMKLPQMRLSVNKRMHQLLSPACQCEIIVK